MTGVDKGDKNAINVKELVKATQMLAKVTQ